MRVFHLPSGIEVRCFASIEELPVERHIRFQQQLIIASGVGHTAQDVEGHFRRLHTLLAHARHEEAAEEAAHLFGAYAFALAGTDLDLLALCCLVAAVSGGATDDLTPDGLQRTAALLTAGGLTMGALRGELAVVKKKFALS